MKIAGCQVCDLSNSGHILYGGHINNSGGGTIENDHRVIEGGGTIVLFDAGEIVGRGSNDKDIVILDPLVYIPVIIAGD
jgi:hypothetical protein